VKLDHLPQREIGPVQALPDFPQSKPQVLEGFDLLQADDVIRGVETMTCFGAPRRREQPDLVVVVKRAH
jgi:hypothetical protein